MGFKTHILAQKHTIRRKAAVTPGFFPADPTIFFKTRRAGTLGKWSRKGGQNGIRPCSHMARLLIPEPYIN